MSSLNSYTDLIYSTLRDSIVEDTELHESFDVSDLKSGGNGYMSNSFIIEIVKQSSQNSSFINSENSYYIYNIRVKILLRRECITSDDGQYYTDKNLILSIDDQIEASFYKTFDTLTGSSLINIIEANYIRSSNPVKLVIDSNDYITMDLDFTVHALGLKRGTI